MNWLVDSIRSHRILWLAATLIVTAVSGNMLMRSEECLKTSAAPLGIVSLELAFDNSSFHAIRQQWSDTVCSNGNLAISNAKRNIIEDMFFLVGYSLFLMTCVVLVHHEKFGARIFHLASWAALSAGLLDAIENMFMFSAVSGVDVHPLFFGIPAGIKFAMIALVVIYILFALTARLWLKPHSTLQNH